MTDIVERLRARKDFGLNLATLLDCLEAADEIERLMLKVEELQIALDRKSEWVVSWWP